jgi:hypothetical protein
MQHAYIWFLDHTNPCPSDKFNLSAVYQLQCAECPQKCIGQTGRKFKVHIRDIKNERQNSKFA